MRHNQKTGNPQFSDSFAQKFRIPPSKDWVLSTVVLLCVSGLLVLATNDENYRQAFVEVAKFVISAYVGYHIPSPRQS